MKFNTAGRAAATLLLCVVASPLWALDRSVPGIQGDVSRMLLGNGTGVVVGIVDSGIDHFHPALSGFDSLGNPRMAARANFVTSEPFNLGDDVGGHGTWVASVIHSRDATYTGMAPDAQFINARVLNSSNSFPNDTPVRNGLGFAINEGAHIINLSLNFFAPNSSGNTQLDLMIDWAAYARGISFTISSGNISGGNGTNAVRGPGSAYNGMTVGRTIADLSKASVDSAGAYTADGRMKPDVVAPGTLLTLANDDWEGPASDWDTGLNGTSFAAPHVAGLMAQMLDAGMSRGWNTNPLVVKASILNSASKSVLDRDSNAWEPGEFIISGDLMSVTRPLDTHLGAGQIDGFAAAQQYLAGAMSPGNVRAVGWDLNAVSGNGYIDYEIRPSLIAGSTLSATLTWHRHVQWIDNGNSIVDANDTFSQIRALSDLNLQIVRDGNVIAESISTRDNVEHLLVDVSSRGRYTLRVIGANVTSATEQYALAWYGVVPEPGSAILLASAIFGLAIIGNRPLLRCSFDQRKKTRRESATWRRRDQ